MVWTGSSEAGRSSHRTPSSGRTRDGILCAWGDGTVPVPRSSLSGCLSGFPIWISTHHQLLTMCSLYYLFFNYM